MSREKILIEQLQAECDRLREENTFLRNLLEIKVGVSNLIPFSNRFFIKPQCKASTRN